MARIFRDENSPKNELGRIYFSDNYYKLEETHRSKRGTYDINIRDEFDNIVYRIQMDREQINRIKENKGISRIDFISEEGFRSFIEYTYMGGREFNEEEFKKKFMTEFYENFRFLKDDFYADAEENGIVDYIQYLLQFIEPEDLETLYYQNAPVLATVWKYNPEGIGQKEKVENAQKIVEKLDAVAREIQIFLNAKGVNYEQWQRKK